ncbi:uncharacterized protein TNCV_2924561 [Trichonephila clavipes]|nr:uncharacterized protein TNCV_2924561 [Trichonephila clavipes]
MKECCKEPLPAPGNRSNERRYREKDLATTGEKKVGTKERVARKTGVMKSSHGWTMYLNLVTSQYILDFKKCPIEVNITRRKRQKREFLEVITAERLETEQQLKLEQQEQLSIEKLRLEIELSMNANQSATENNGDKVSNLLVNLGEEELRLRIFKTGCAQGGAIEDKLSKLVKTSISVDGKLVYALLDSGTEITVIKKYLVPGISVEGASTIYLKGIFGPAFKCPLVYVPIGLATGGQVNVVHQQVLCALAEVW